MAHPAPHLDWQALVALALVVVAAAYLARRWWPGLRGLFGPALPATPTPAGEACGSSGAQASAASCNVGGSGGGCGNCGHHATPLKDHRVHIVRRPSHSGHRQQG